MNKTKEELAKKLDFFLIEKIPVHIEFGGGKFWNGLLLSKKGEEVWVINEIKFGKKFVFLQDVFDVDSYSAKVLKTDLSKDNKEGSFYQA